MSDWYVYIVRCQDGSLYTGATTDLAGRVSQHNAGKGARYTRSRLPVELVYQECVADRAAALRREHAIKRMPRSRKSELVDAGEILRRIHTEIGLPGSYAMDRGLPIWPEARKLVDVGPNIIGRRQKLAPATAAAWHEMQQRADAEGIQLLLVSGFRSIDYQVELFRKKLTDGQAIADILRVNAAPGYSQHHTGRAVDLATPGCRPLDMEFERSDAFTWLELNAAGFGFSMSYGRDNPWGIEYEPWHWFMAVA